MKGLVAIAVAIGVLWLADNLLNNGRYAEVAAVTLQLPLAFLARQIGRGCYRKNNPQVPTGPNAPNVRLLPRESVFESDGTLPSGDITKRPRDTGGRFQERLCYS